MPPALNIPSKLTIPSPEAKLEETPSGADTGEDTEETKVGDDQTKAENPTKSKYRAIASEILDDFIYLGSDMVAQNKEELQRIGITHIVNCSGDYSQNYYPEDFKYKKYHLKDHPIENIESVFYDAIKFMEECEDGKGKCYLHCVQGISRSATLVMSYLILKRGWDYKTTFEFIQTKRPIVNPNLSFITQLMWLQKRLYAPFDQIPVYPRIYIVSSHEKEDPTKIVAKLSMEHFFVEKMSKSMDPRGLFLI